MREKCLHQQAIYPKRGSGIPCGNRAQRGTSAARCHNQGANLDVFDTWFVCVFALDMFVQIVGVVCIVQCVVYKQAINEIHGTHGSCDARRKGEKRAPETCAQRLIYYICLKILFLLLFVLFHIFKKASTFSVARNQ